MKRNSCSSRVRSVKPSWIADAAISTSLPPSTRPSHATTSTTGTTLSPHQPWPTRARRVNDAHVVHGRVLSCVRGDGRSPRRSRTADHFMGPLTCTEPVAVVLIKRVAQQVGSTRLGAIGRLTSPPFAPTTDRTPSPSTPRHSADRPEPTHQQSGPETLAASRGHHRRPRLHHPGRHSRPTTTVNPPPPTKVRTQPTAPL